MNKYIERITTATEQFLLSRVKNNSLLAEYYNRSDKRVDYKRQSTNYEKKEINDWKVAIMSATDPENPRRGLLMRFYESLLLDLHLGSCIDNRILPIQCAKSKLTDKNGVEDQEAHKLLEKPWFLELIKMVVNSTFMGTTLIELFDVNESGEVKEVKEIPQSNFLAHKGIIINEEWDDNGTSYKEGIYSNYYIQVGSDSSLGLLNQLAMIVLAKKLGIGSWMSYIEKFGIPPIFLTTERMDPTRTNQLFDMLMNFKSNGFVIAQGQEKIEFPTSSVDGYQSFKALNDTCDAAMSKRLLGGTGTTDEKSFVGSAEVHERLLKYRNQVDKLLFKFYFNESIKPRLIKLSSVYAPLANLTFDFDEKETLTLKETIGLIKDLSQYYDFDIDEIAKITGLPIIAVKSAMGQTTEPTSQKKKSDAKLNAVHAQYAPFKINGFTIFAATWDAAVDRLANQIYNGEIKPEDLDRDLLLKNYAAFNKEAEKAWGQGYYDNPITRKLRENLLQFSGAKSYALIQDIKDLAKQKLPKEKFIEEAKKRVQIHNETYLEVEKKFTANSTSSTRNYEAFKEDSDIYPCLKNRTMGDDNVRNSHAINDGVIKPINEWKVIPPYDPGCRCWLEQTNEPPTLDRHLQNIDAKWANNPSLTGRIFNETHSYFANISGKLLQKVRDNTDDMKDFTPYNHTIEVGENTVFVSDFADMSDLNINIEAAKILSKAMDTNIYVRPHKYIQDVKNPELGIGKSNEIADLKSWNIKHTKKIQSFIKNGIGAADEQGCKHVALDITQAPDIENMWEKVANKLRGELSDRNQMNTHIQKVMIIKNGKAAVFTRQQINSKDYLKHFNDEALK